MSFTITDFDDLLKIVNTQPEWRHRLIRSLFPEIDVPRALQELADAQKRTEVGLQRLEATVRELIIGQVELRKDVGGLRVGQEELRKDVGELRVGQEELRVGQKELRKDVGELRVGQDGLRKDVTVLQRDVATIKSDVRDLKGDSHERFYRDRSVSVFGRYLRNGRDIANLVADKLFDALDSGRITEAEHRQVLAADLFWGGEVRGTNELVILVLEASWRAEISDVERASTRSAILRRIGLNALGVVGAREWSESAATLARTLSVITTTNGRLDDTSWATAWSAFPELSTPIQ